MFRSTCICNVHIKEINIIYEIKETQVKVIKTDGYTCTNGQFIDGHTMTERHKEIHE